MADTTTPGREAPTGELLRQLSDQMSTLVQQEIALAKAEVGEKGKRAGIGAGMFGGAGVTGFYMVGALLATVVLVLIEVGLDAWIASAIVTAVLGVIAAVLALGGKKQVEQATPPAPERAIASVKQDTDTIRARAAREERLMATEEQKTPDEIRSDIEQTREELGDTVEALGAKTDVKGRAHDKVEDAKADAKAKVTDLKDKVTPSKDGGSGGGGGPVAAAQPAADAVRRNPLPFAVGAALLIGFLIGRGARMNAFAPVSIVAGLVAGRLARGIFTKIWGEIRDEEPPSPEHREIFIGQLMVALIVEGAIARLVRGLTDHGARRAWANRTGTWPGEERPEPE